MFRAFNLHAYHIGHITKVKIILQNRIKTLINNSKYTVTNI